MIAASDLIDRVHAVGGEVVRVGDRLRLVAPAGAITPELRDALRAAKPALLEFLAPHPCAACGRFAFPVPGLTCYWCQRPQRAGGICP